MSDGQRSVFVSVQVFLKPQTAHEKEAAQTNSINATSILDLPRGGYV